MSERKKPVLLNQTAAKITRRRRTADEAGFTLSNFDNANGAGVGGVGGGGHGGQDPAIPLRYPKLLRRDTARRGPKLAEVKESEFIVPATPAAPVVAAPAIPTPLTQKQRAHRQLKPQSSIRLSKDNNETAAACDWPMTGKEKAHPSHVVRRVVDDGNGMNVTFPLVYDISQTIVDDGGQMMDADMTDDFMDDGNDSYQTPMRNGRRIDPFNFNSVLSQLRTYQQGVDGDSDRRRSIDTNAIRTAVSAFSNLTVSERSKSGGAATINGKNKKRPVYLLIIFASFDADNHLKCDAYITCVNRVPGRSQQRLGINWIMSQLIEMFEQQQAASGRFNGSQKWMLACCLVEALAQNPRLLTVNAYWRNGLDGHELPPVDMLRQIAGHMNIKNALQDGTDLATLAVSVASQLVSQSVASNDGEQSMLEFGNGCHTSIAPTDRVYENLAMMTMMSKAACWLIEEFNRLNVQQLTAAPTSSTTSSSDDILHNRRLS